MSHWPAGVTVGERRPVYWQAYHSGAAWMHRPTGVELGSIWSADDANDIREVRACRPVSDPDRGVMPSEATAVFETVADAQAWVEAFSSRPDPGPSLACTLPPP